MCVCERVMKINVGGGAGSDSSMLLIFGCVCFGTRWCGFDSEEFVFCIFVVSFGTENAMSKQFAWAKTERKIR